MAHLSGTPTRLLSSEHLTQLSAQIHSSSEQESRFALHQLAQTKSNDSARALIDAYRHCHWRDTRISVIRALGKNASERAIDFLLCCAQEEDIGLVQEALIALGETSDPVAATFLLNRLNDAPIFLKACLVSALAKVPDLRAAEGLRNLLKSKEATEHPQLLRNCVVALSEMKDTLILNDLIAMLRQRVQANGHPPDATALTLLSGIAKLSRAPSDLSEFERAFEGEMLHNQYFQQSLTQVTFRQQWTLEDYLGKIFFSEHIQRSLPLELNSFSSNDVSEALSIFAPEDKHFNRLCLALASLIDAEELYRKFVHFDRLDSEQTIQLLGSFAMHRTPFARELCHQIFETRLKSALASEQSADLFSAWLRAIICIEKEPNLLLNQLLSSHEFLSDWHERNKVELINAFVSCSLALRTERSWPKRTLQQLSELIHKESSALVLGRWIRAQGELGLSDLKWSDELLNRVLQTQALCASALLMLERENEHQNTGLLRAIQKLLEKNNEALAPFLRACSRLKNSEKDLPSDEIVQAALSSARSDEQLAALAYLTAHPRALFLERLNTLCNPESENKQVVVASIVAARSYKNEKSVENLARCLMSTHRVFAGRALDTLLAIEHSAARHAVVTYFVQHLNDISITDKVLRSLKAPQQGDEQLAALLESATEHTGNVTLKDDMIELAQRLRSGAQAAGPAVANSDIIRSLDKRLEGKIADYNKLTDPIKASLRSAELPLLQPELFEGSVDKSASVVQYCKAIDLALERDFGQKLLFPKMEQQLHLFQNILHRAELDQESPNINLVIRHFGAEHVFDLHSFPSSKMMMICRSILTGRILRERTQVIDGLKAWAVILMLFSGHEKLWGAAQMKKDPLLYHQLAHKLVLLQDLRNPAAHRQTMLALAPLSEIRKEVFNVFAQMKKAFI